MAAPGRGAPGRASGSTRSRCPMRRRRPTAPGHIARAAGRPGIGPGTVVDPDGPAPTLFMGGQATERSPRGGGVHQRSVADDTHTPEGSLADHRLLGRMASVWSNERAQSVGPHAARAVCPSSTCGIPWRRPARGSPPRRCGAPSAPRYEVRAPRACRSAGGPAALMRMTVPSKRWSPIHVHPASAVEVLLGWMWRCLGDCGASVADPRNRRWRWDVAPGGPPVLVERAPRRIGCGCVPAPRGSTCTPGWTGHARCPARACRSGRSAAA